MNIEEFWKALRERGGYETPEGQFRRFLGTTDTGFYTKVWGVVFSAYGHALRGQFDGYAWARHSLKMLQAAETSGGRARFWGYENIRQAKLPVVYVANHMSGVETMVLPGSLMAFGPLATVVKVDLLSVPFFGRVLSQISPIAVGRKDPREDLKQVLDKGEAILRAGTSIMIFPQSTRQPVFDPARFNSLGAKLARRAGTQVVPVALKTDFQGVGKWIRDIGPLDRSKEMLFKMGPPLTVTGTGRDAHEAALRFITDSLREWGARIKGEGEDRI